MYGVWEKIRGPGAKPTRSVGEHINSVWTAPVVRIEQGGLRHCKAVTLPLHHRATVYLVYLVQFSYCRGTVKNLLVACYPAWLQSSHPQRSDTG